MGPANEVFPDGWLTNSIVGEGSAEAARASVQNYFDAVNNKDYDKAFTYIISQASTNPRRNKMASIHETGTKGRCSIP